jgi:hypothetical protein
VVKTVLRRLQMRAARQLQQQLQLAQAFLVGGAVFWRGPRMTCRASYRVANGLRVGHRRGKAKRR